MGAFFEPVEPVEAPVAALVVLLSLVTLADADACQMPDAPLEPQPGTSLKQPADRQTARAFRLIYDYTVGFALADPTSPGQQLVQDTAARGELHAFLRSLPPDRFPLTAALGEHVWAADCDEQFSTGLATLITGLQRCG